MAGKPITINTKGINPSRPPDQVLKPPTAAQVAEARRQVAAHLLTRPRNTDVVALQEWSYRLASIRLPIELAESRLGEWVA